MRGKMLSMRKGNKNPKSMISIGTLQDRTNIN